MCCLRINSTFSLHVSLLIRLQRYDIFSELANSMPFYHSRYAARKKMLNVEAWGELAYKYGGGVVRVLYASFNHLLITY